MAAEQEEAPAAPVAAPVAAPISVAAANSSGMHFLDENGNQMPFPAPIEENPKLTPVSIAEKIDEVEKKVIE